MGKFNVDPEQQEELDGGADYTTPTVLPGAAGLSKGTYHNPATGKEIISLRDPYHIMLRLRQGWRLGPAPPELRERWKIREAELKAEDDRYEAEYAAAHPHLEDQQAQFNDAVAAAAKAAVVATLEQLGVPLPDAGVEKSAPEPEEREGTQLKFDLPAGAPSESETKHVVSHAHSPELHLVGHREEQT
jgi:hypothetical protein